MEGNGSEPGETEGQSLNALDEAIRKLQAELNDSDSDSEESDSDLSTDLHTPQEHYAVVDGEEGVTAPYNSELAGEEGIITLDGLCEFFFSRR